MSDTKQMLAKVRQALGRSAPLAQTPVPPVLEEPIVRLVHSEIGLAELFARRAGELKMQVEFVSPDELASVIVAFIQTNKIKRVGMSVSRLLARLGVSQALHQAGIEAKSWDQLTLDEFYDFDCGVTNADYAVAETGSLVILPKPGHGRALSLTPMFHICVLEPRNFLPDLIDLFEKLKSDHPGTDAVLISGPSKTSDIEMTPVTGVHGPNLVKTFILR